MRCLRNIQGITGQDRIPNKDVLAKAGVPSLFALLSQRRLRWFGHVRRMKDGYLVTDTRPTGRSKMSANVTWRQAALIQQTGKPKPQTAVVGWLLSGHASARVKGGDRSSGRRKKERKKQTAETTAETGAKTFKCRNCSRFCGSRIGLYSHSMRCRNPDWHTLGAQSIVFRDRRWPTNKYYYYYYYDCHHYYIATSPLAENSSRPRCFPVPSQRVHYQFDLRNHSHYS